MKNETSFTQVVKEELCNNDYPSRDRLRALLAAYIRINGHLVLQNKSSILTFQTENAKIAKFIYKTIIDIYHAPVHFVFEKKSGFSKSTVYTTTIKEMGEEILGDLDVSFLEGKISKDIVKNDDTISGYLAGAFLASGSVNSPESSNYHLEICLNNENYAKWLSKLFARYKNTKVEPKVVKRRDNYIIYLKKSDKIADFLIMIGAVSSCMQFESVRVDRDYLNVTNRLTNLDTANMSKTVSSAEKQAKWIKEIDNQIGIDNITEKKIKLLCRLRLQNESASMLELSSMMSEALKINVSKSNVAHLFRKIEEKYLKLGGK